MSHSEIWMTKYLKVLRNDYWCFSTEGTLFKKFLWFRDVDGNVHEWNAVRSKICFKISMGWVRTEMKYDWPGVNSWNCWLGHEVHYSVLFVYVCGGAQWKVLDAPCQIIRNYYLERDANSCLLTTGYSDLAQTGAMKGQKRSWFLRGDVERG